MKVLMIIPAYNEEKNIVKTVNSILEYQKQCDFTLDYIVINDGSTDKTYDVCKQNHFKCINLIQNLGIGGAVQTGYLYAQIKDYDIAVQFDGDGQHDVNFLKCLIQPIADKKADFVIGSRFLEETSTFKSTLIRRVGIRYLSILLRIFTLKKITDPTSGFRAANKNAIDLLSKDYPVDYPEPESIVYLLKNCVNVTEVPVNMFEREEGSSSIHSLRSVYYMIKVSFAIFCANFQRKVRK